MDFEGGSGMIGGAMCALCIAPSRRDSTLFMCVVRDAAGGEGLSCACPPIVFVQVFCLAPCLSSVGLHDLGVASFDSRAAWVFVDPVLILPFVLSLDIAWLGAHLSIPAFCTPCTRKKGGSAG